MNSIGERIKIERNKLLMTQAQFGKLVGVSERTQQNYESGARCPDSDYLEAFYKYTGANIHYLITGIPFPEDALKKELNLILDAYEVVEEKLGNKIKLKKKRELAFALYELYKETDSTSDKLTNTVLKLVVSE